MAQWSRICLPMQGTWLDPFSANGYPTCPGANKTVMLQHQNALASSTLKPVYRNEDPAQQKKKKRRQNKTLEAQNRPISHWHTTFSLAYPYASFVFVLNHCFPTSVSKESSEGATFSVIRFSSLSFSGIELCLQSALLFSSFSKIFTIRTKKSLSTKENSSEKHFLGRVAHVSNVLTSQYL